MKITKIERQKKNPSRFSLSIDDEYAIGIHKEVLLKSGLRSGDSITEKTLDDLKRNEELFHARESALRLLSYRARSKQEIRDRLKKKGISAEIAGAVLHSLESSGLVNDLEFAKAFAHNKLLKKPMGKKMLRLELRRKGINKEMTEQVLSEAYGSDSEEEFALELAKKRAKRGQGRIGQVERLKQRKRLSDYLAWRGFGWDTVSRTVAKVLGEIEE
jgi:regulatory protein